MSPTYSPMPDRPQFNFNMANGAAAIVVAMINQTPGFDIKESDHREAVKTAIKEIMPAYIAAIVKGQAELGREDYE